MMKVVFGQGSSVAALSLSRPVAISRAGLANRSGLGRG